MVPRAVHSRCSVNSAYLFSMQWSSITRAYDLPQSISHNSPVGTFCPSPVVFLFLTSFWFLLLSTCSCCIPILGCRFPNLYHSNVRVGCLERTASKHVYYQGWNRSPAQVGCMRQVLGPGALGRPRGIGWRRRWEGGSRWGIHVNPWLIHVNVWQKPRQYCKVIGLQLI